MPFIRIPGLAGRVYQPDGAATGTRKHPCPDCYCCQVCGDERCAACRAGRDTEAEQTGQADGAPAPLACCT